jgi:hypothetical protein
MGKPERCGNARSMGHDDAVGHVVVRTRSGPIVSIPRSMIQYGPRCSLPTPVARYFGSQLMI